MTCPSGVGAQEAGESPPSIEKINSEYQRELAKIERLRLERLGQLAASQPMDQAESTYRDYFQLAIAKGLFLEAEPVAERLLQAGDTPSQIHTLANLINIVAEADRGEYEKSLQSLVSAISEKARQGKPGRDLGLPAASRAAIVDAYYQRLLRGYQYEVARKAMKLVAENAEQPAIRDLANRRTQQLELVGRDAPPIVGVDLDGQTFRLEAAKGDVVLVVFWATWCLPVAQELPWLQETYKKYHEQGFRIIGIDVDTVQSGNMDPSSVIPAVRRFLIDYNIPWPTLLNGAGDADFARAYSVSEIPANVLIGRDGKVAHLDLVGPSLEKAVGEAISQKP
ncbi:TlpA disulfide reductase family protein [Tundrisphaera lichenicola]|uniref:TlpA disulfide reductase family protein n=1 Tax=Tundrisphaera lichenicola TaxID=2029860 RepID=UPI003EBE902C